MVNTLGGSLKSFEERCTRSGISLKLVMDQSVYVRASIKALVQEGLIGAILCSLVILVFLGELRMTGIAIMTLPISCMACSAALYFTGQTINVMTLAGMTLAIGPMIDSAIICLENTHRHLAMGATPRDAAVMGASEVAMPELVSSLCTFMVLTPLLFTPGLGPFLFKPMAMAVTFSMIAAYILSRTLVPTCSAYWLKGHAGGHGEGSDGGGHGHGDAHGHVPAAHEPEHNAPDTFQIIGNGNGTRPAPARHVHPGLEPVAGDDRRGNRVLRQGPRFRLRHRLKTVFVGYGLLVVVNWYFWPILRREFFPEVDAGAFEMYVRAPAACASRKPKSGSRPSRISSARPSARKTCSSFSRRSASRQIGRPPTR